MTQYHSGKNYFTGKPIEFVIQSFLPKAQVVLFQGEEGSGKTKLALAMARCVGLGIPFLGQKSMSGNIVYYNLDRNHRSELEQRCKELSRSDKDFSWIDKIEWCEDPINMLGVVDMKEKLHSEDGTPYIHTTQIPTLDHIINYHKGKDIQLIVFDTLSRLIIGSNLDENNATEMTLLMDNMTTIARETGAAVLLLHHRPKDTERFVGRGSSAIPANCDLELLITGRIVDKIEIDHRKARNHNIQIFPVSIDKGGFKLTVDSPTGEPEGAWLAVISDHQTQKTAFEQLCEWFEKTMLRVGIPHTDHSVIIDHQSIKTAFDLNKRDKMHEVIKHYIDNGKIDKEKHGNNPRYYIHYEKEEIEKEKRRRNRVK